MSHSKVGKNKYRIFVSDGFNLDGSRRRPSTTIETNLKGKDLKEFLAKAEVEFTEEIKKRDPKFDKLAKGTFEAYSVWWIDYKISIDGIAPKTKQEYKKFLKTRILRYIGNKILNKITNADMVELIKTIKESPAKTETGKLSDKTIKHYHTLLNTMFNDAVKLKILTENPMKDISVKTPKVILKDNYYDLRDIIKLLKLLSKEPIKYQLAVLLDMSTGMREGEIFGIQWKHLNYMKTEVKIEQENCYTKEEGSFIKSTKNEFSERVTSFPPILISLFLAYEKEEIRRKELLGDKWYYGKDSKHEDDFVFTQRNGKFIFVGSIPKWFRKFLKKHNLKHITFHGLRHTTATTLIAEGIDVKNISAKLGHSRTSTTTDIYAHSLRSVEKESANIFDDIFKYYDDGDSLEDMIEKRAKGRSHILNDLFENIKSGTQSGTQTPNLKVVK